MKLLAYYIIFLLSLFSCKGDKKNVADSLPTEKDINEVIKAIVFHKGLHIASENSRSPIATELKNRVIIDRRKNSEIHRGPRKSIDTLAIADLTESTNSTIKHFFNNDDWQFIKLQNNNAVQKLSPKIFGNLKFTTIHEKHEDWYFYFSVPIFSSDLKRAYVHYNGIYHDYCNDGTAYFLEKKNGKWEIIENTFWSH